MQGKSLNLIGVKQQQGTNKSQNKRLPTLLFFEQWLGSKSLRSWCESGEETDGHRKHPRVVNLLPPYMESKFGLKARTHSKRLMNLSLTISHMLLPNDGIDL